jgi:tripartite-type tricarboxylate transporter receptor subunit TctC
MFPVRKSILALIAPCVLMSATASHAQERYPSRPITIVVPFSPGGGVDTVARLLAEKMRASFKQTVLVENKPGGGAMIGAGAVARSEPDGYTMLLGTAGEMAIAPHIHKNMRYQPEKDFAPLALIAKVPNVMVVNASLPVKNVDELVSYAKKTSGGVTYSTSGVGNMQHLNGELFNKLAGINMLHVPYKGAAGQLQDAVSGEVDLSFVSYAAAKGFIDAGKLRAIGVTSAKRAGFVPNIPAIRESAGLSAYQLDNWFGLFLPAGTPEPVQAAIHSAVASAMKDPEFDQKMRGQGFEPSLTSPAEFREFIKAESKKLEEIVKAANIAAE